MKSRSAGRYPGRMQLASPIDDAAAVQVVRRKLDLDPVAGQDADPVAPHLPGRVADRGVTVVELDAKHAVPQRLGHLTLELALLFFHTHPGLPAVRRARRPSPRGLSGPHGLRTSPLPPQRGS